MIPRLHTCLFLYLLGSLMAPPCAHAIDFTSVNLPADTELAVEQPVAFDFEVIGTTETSDTVYNYNVYVTGDDFYGNTVFFPVAQGALNVRGEISDLPPGATEPVTLPAVTAGAQGQWRVPKDGTLHNLGAGYTMWLVIYEDGASFAPDGSSFPNSTIQLQTQTVLGPISSGKLTVSVPATVQIPSVSPASKIQAAATASVVDGAVQLALTSFGSGYDPNFPPAVAIGAPPDGGTQAEVLAIINPQTGSITGFNTINPGTGYVDPPTVDIDPPPSYMTQRTGGVLYKAGTYNGGDISRFQISVANTGKISVANTGMTVTRPLSDSGSDKHRWRLVLTTDPKYEEDDASDSDDFLLDFGDIFGDRPFLSPQSTTRAVKVYNTPGTLDPYGLPPSTRTPAEATAFIDDNGSVDLITVDVGGGVYSSPPIVTITGGGGFGAIAEAEVDGATGEISAVNIINPGAGYTDPPTVIIAVPLIGARAYTPLPDDGFLDIGEQVQLDFEIMMPKNFGGIYYVAARIDAFNNSSFEPRTTQEILDEKTRVSDISARVTLLSGADESTGIISQVSSSGGKGLLQSNGSSDRSALSGTGRYAVFQSLATDLPIPQSNATTATADFPSGYSIPLIGDFVTTTPTYQDLIGPYLASNSFQQIYRRNLDTREIIAVSLSTRGAYANGDCQNPAVNRASLDAALDGMFVCFESVASNLIDDDRNFNSDIFVRSYGALQTVKRASINSDGEAGNSGSYRPSISSNGRFIAFESTASNLDLANPVPDVSNLGSQIYVHDRDISNSGTLDTPGNVRTYLVSMANSGSTRATASVAGVDIINGQVSAVTLDTIGEGYISDHPPAVVIDPPPTAPGATQAVAEAVVDETTGALSSIRIVSPGTGYNPAAPPTVTVAPRGRPAGDASGNNGWNNQPKISDDGKYVTWVSYSSNLPRKAGELANVGNSGWRGVVYRIKLLDGIPLTPTIEPVSVNSTDTKLANQLAYEPSINGDGSVIAFTTWANNLAGVDSNGAADVYVRDYRDGLETTFRVSESQPRLAYGLLGFFSTSSDGAPPNSNPAPGDEVTLNDGSNPPLTFTFVGAAAAPGDVAIGATASATRDNLIKAINDAFRNGQINIIAGDIPSGLLRSVNTGTDETIMNALDLLNFVEGSANTPATVPLSGGLPGQALNPALFLLHTDPEAPNPNQAITASGQVFGFGMQGGGRQAEEDSGAADGVPLGSDQPAIDQSGNTVAFRSTMRSLDVFDRTATDTRGIFRGERLRMLSNFCGNIYVAERDPATGVTLKSTRASVNRFGYKTTGLAGIPSTGASHAPALSGNGRLITFSSDSENNGGLIFDATNLEPQDSNGYRDIFYHDRLIATDLPTGIDNNRPSAVLTEPLWLSGNKISTGSIITVAALVTDEDQPLTADNVRFIINGEPFAPTEQYGNYFTFSYTILTESESNSILARVTDDSGADNNTGLSQSISFTSTEPIVAPTSIDMMAPDFTVDPDNPSGIPTVGFAVRISARVTLPFVGNTGLYAGGLVRFYANGVLIGEQSVTAGATGQLVSIDWFPASSGAVELSAVAVTFTNYFATANPETWSTLASNTLPSFTIAGTGAEAVLGSPEATASALFQTVMSRAPSNVELAYYTEQLANNSLTPAGMVADLVQTEEYTNLQNRLFDFYYRLETSPLSYTYNGLLSNIRANLTPLQAIAVSAGVTNPPSPYGATEGQATAAQQIVDSPAFTEIWTNKPLYTGPPPATLSDQNFVDWFTNQMALFGGTTLSYTKNAVYQALMPGSTAPKGSAVAFLTAFATAANSSKYGPLSPYQYQLKASALEWLFTGLWVAPSTLQFTTETALDSFIGELLDRSTGQTTWSWLDTELPGAPAADRTATAEPAGDGITNLEKYAFNMDPETFGGTLPLGGDSGTPRGDVVSSNGLNYLQITYIRRVNSPSTSYYPEFSWEVNGVWTRTDATNEETVTPVGTDGLFERVTIRDIVPTSVANARFGRVVLEAAYWSPEDPTGSEVSSPDVP